MTLAELKISIHAKIDHLDAPDCLDMLNAMLYSKEEVFVIRCA